MQCGCRSRLQTEELRRHNTGIEENNEPDDLYDDPDDLDAIQQDLAEPLPPPPSSDGPGMDPGITLSYMIPLVNGEKVRSE